ncbi:acyl-CoA thioesterase [Geomonas sp. RF6]|uniref:acyl-CoA thioesterase n=1 Tax=Geomonas sp. RF6 TaxID=2897342 RepID=UPI001E415A71|nr:acyl-CoA thioesterase [Geomonas sp. RF6]UFS69367.1 acyl-CoA thioesterase [Geomonas sp. RF6]
MSKHYFPKQEGAPPSLSVTVERQVRFEEVDPLAIVWHGRYPSFFEDARVAFGAKYGVGYLDCYRNGFLTPIKKMHVDYFRPLSFPEPFTIEGILHWTPAARLNFEFIIRNGEGEVTTTGYTVQMMVDTEQNVLLIPPPFIRDFLDRWQAGELS